MPFIIILFILAGCVDANTVYHSSRDVSVLGWSPKDSLKWEVNGLDSAARYQIEINVRNDNSYPYENLGLEISIQKGDTLLACDTVDYKLVNQLGAWEGRGWGSLYETSFPYKQIQIPDTGKYTFIIRPCMNDWELKGINSVGITIQKRRNQ
ncbi:MAG: gliding motility lipoprotein GldH [Bacteroidales bacterium]